MNVDLEQKHSGMGIASLIISIGVGCMMFLLICVAGYLNAQRMRGSVAYPGQTAVGFIVIALFAADVFAAGLAIGSFFQPQRKRVCGVLGLVFSGMTILGTALLIIIGLIYKSQLRSGGI